ncbi:MAG: DNA polymerase III subunit chi [Woeseiaceae bacterium]
MPRVDFYILADDQPDAHDAFVCRLVAKASRLDHQIHLLCENKDQLSTLDTLLWTFSDTEFVAHDQWPSDDCAATVTLGLAAHGLPETTQVCVNLSGALAPDCERIAEIIAGDDTQKAKGRERYASYRENGATMNTHQIGAS